jgi:hypothetical protein
MSGAPYYAEAFSPLPGRCFRLVSATARLGRLTAPSPSPGAGPGEPPTDAATGSRLAKATGRPRTREAAPLPSLGAGRRGGRPGTSRPGRLATRPRRYLEPAVAAALWPAGCVVEACTTQPGRRQAEASWWFGSLPDRCSRSRVRRRPEEAVKDFPRLQSRAARVDHPKVSAPRNRTPYSHSDPASTFPTRRADHLALLGRHVELLPALKRSAGA